MPKLNEIVQDRDNKKFVKKKYRPWDLSGDSSPNYEEGSALQTSEICLTKTDSNNPPLSNHLQLSGAPKSLEKHVDKDVENAIDIIRETNRLQPDNMQISISNQLDSTKKTHQESISKQLDINLDPTTPYHQLLKLSGVQKNILNFVVDISRIRGGFETGPIETSTIALYTKSSIGVVKISIKRLIDKGFITRKKGKQAKGGYINLSINDELLNAVIDQRTQYNNLANPEDLINSIRYQLDNYSLYSSSSSTIKTITTKKQTELPKEWQEVDFNSLSHIGFNKTQIKQLIESSDPELVQESINHFAFGMEYNSKFQKYDDPLNVLMGVLRKGQGWFEKDYRSPKEIAQTQLLERKKLEIDRKQEQENEAYKLAFTEWQQNLTPTDINEIAPIKKNHGDITPQPAKLNIYFKENIWPNKKIEYLI